MRGRLSTKLGRTSEPVSTISASAKAGWIAKAELTSSTIERAVTRARS